MEEQTRSWRPKISYYERYGKWALDRWEPCETCSPEYKALYGKLEGTMEAAELCFRRAYQLCAELAGLNELPEMDEGGD